MTVHASHSPGLVGTAAPEHLIALVVAGEAGRIPLLDWGGGTFSETNGNCVLAAAGRHVGLARSMTRFAAKFLLATLGMRHGVAHDGVNEALLLVRMAGHTNFRADVIAVGLARKLCGAG